MLQIAGGDDRGLTGDRRSSTCLYTTEPKLVMASDCTSPDAAFMSCIFAAARFR